MSEGLSWLLFSLWIWAVSNCSFFILFSWYRLRTIYQSLLDKIEAADSSKDLRWWSVKYGPGMPKKWPEFEVSCWEMENQRCYTKWSIYTMPLSYSVIWYGVCDGVSVVQFLLLVFAWSSNMHERLHWVHWIHQYEESYSKVVSCKRALTWFHAC